jgi:hypothetical protein
MAKAEAPPTRTRGFARQTPRGDLDAARFAAPIPSALAEQLPKRAVKEHQALGRRLVELQGKVRDLQAKVEAAKLADSESAAVAFQRGEDVPRSQEAVAAAELSQAQRALAGAQDVTMRSADQLLEQALTRTEAAVQLATERRLSALQRVAELLSAAQGELTTAREAGGELVWLKLAADPARGLRPRPFRPGSGQRSPIDGTVALASQQVHDELAARSAGEEPKRGVEIGATARAVDSRTVKARS